MQKFSKLIHTILETWRAVSPPPRAAGRCRHRDVHGGVGVLDDVHVHVIGDGHPVFGKHRPGIAHEALLQGLVLPAGGKEVGELVSLFGRGPLLQGTACAVIRQSAQVDHRQ